MRINDGLWLEIEKGTLTRKRLHEIRWNTIFSELGIDFDGVVFEKTFLEFLFDSHEHVDGADEILKKYLSGKYTPVRRFKRHTSPADKPSYKGRDDRLF